MSVGAHFALWGDILSRNAIATASDPDSAYLPQNCVTPHARRPAKLTTNEGWIKLTHSGAVNPVAAALIYSSYDVDLPVVLEGSADDFSSTPFSQQFDILGPHDDGEFSSTFMWLDNNPSYQYWRVNNTGNANSRLVEVRAILLLGELRPMISDIGFGVDFGEEHGGISHKTALGVETVIPLGGKERDMDGTSPATEAGNTEIIKMRRAQYGRYLPFLFIPDININDPWFVRFVSARQVAKKNDKGFFPQQFHIREVARGLSWPAPTVLP